MKRATFVPIKVRYAPERRRQQLRRIVQAAATCSLHSVHNGNGTRYHVLRYRHRGSAQSKQLYAGQMSARIAKQIRDDIAEAKATREAHRPRLNLPMDRIRVLRKALRDANRLARTLARKTGFQFRGHALRRRRNHADFNG